MTPGRLSELDRDSAGGRHRPALHCFARGVGLGAISTPLQAAQLYRGTPVAKRLREGVHAPKREVPPVRPNLRMYLTYRVNHTVES